MKKIYLLLVLIAAYSVVNAQVTVNASVKKKFSRYNEGDSVTLYGYIKNLDNTGDFIIKEDGEYKRISSTKFNVVNSKLGFWDHFWLYNRAGDILTRGWDSDLRNSLFSDCKEFIQNLEKNELLFEDDYLQDYLSQLIHKICPTKLNKPRNNYLTVYVMKSNEAQSFSFDNGTIILSTKLLAELKSEEELVRTLSKEITNVVLEHNLFNLKQKIRADRAASFWTGFAAVASTAVAVNSAVNGKHNFTFNDALAVTLATNLISNGILESMGAKYSDEQLNRATFYSDLFFKTEYKTELKTPDEYNRIISNVISYNAWQHFYALEYNDAMDLINRLENAGIATEDDYLLKAKIYRTIYNTDESNYEALRCIKTAKNLGIIKLVDLSKEEGLLYLRIGDKSKAKIAFEEYRSGMEELQAKGGESDSELRWVRTVMFKNNL